MKKIILCLALLIGCKKGELSCPLTEARLTRTVLVPARAVPAGAAPGRFHYTTTQNIYKLGKDGGLSPDIIRLELLLPFPHPAFAGDPYLCYSFSFSPVSGEPSDERQEPLDLCLYDSSCQTRKSEAEFLSVLRSCVEFR